MFLGEIPIKHFLTFIDSNTTATINIRCNGFNVLEISGKSIALLHHVLHQIHTEFRGKGISWSISLYASDSAFKNTFWDWLLKYLHLEIQFELSLQFYTEHTRSIYNDQNWKKYFENSSSFIHISRLSWLCLLPTPTLAIVWWITLILNLDLRIPTSFSKKVFKV